MVTKGYGFTVDDIDWSSPADLKPYEKAHKLEMKEQDNLMYMWFGSYALSAVSVAVEHNFAGRKANSKYIDKPIMQSIEEQNKPMSEEELQKQRELFVARLQVMQSNFELNHKKEKKTETERN